MPTFEHNLNSERTCTKCGVTITNLDDGTYLHEFPPDLYNIRILYPSHTPCSGLPSSFQKDKIYPLFYHRNQEVIDSEYGKVSFCVLCGVRHTRYKPDRTMPHLRYRYKFAGTDHWLEDFKYAFPCSHQLGIIPVAQLPSNHSWSNTTSKDAEGNFIEARLCSRCGIVAPNTTTVDNYYSHHYLWSPLIPISVGATDSSLRSESSAPSSIPPVNPPPSANCAECLQFLCLHNLASVSRNHETSQEQDVSPAVPD